MGFELVPLGFHYKQMANLLQKIIDPESFSGFSFKERQKRRLFNMGCFTGSFFCLFFCVVSILYGLNRLAWLTAFDMVALWMGIVLCHLGLFRIARHISINASVLFFVSANYF